MALACILAGGAARGQSPGQPPAAPEPLTFVAYNLKNYLPMDRRVGGELVEAAPKPEPEIAALVAIVAAAEPDVVGVCEIGSRRDARDLQGRLAEKGVDLPHVEWVEASDTDRHLAVFSRFPVVARDPQTDLTYRIDTQTLAFQRGILDVTVAPAEGYELRLIGLHLKSKREIPEADQALMRRNEAHLVRRHIDAILESDPDVNLLVFGDLNDTRNEPPVRAIQGRFGTSSYLRDIQLADDLGYRWTYHWSYADSYQRFDYVLASRGLYPEVLADQSYIASSPDWNLASDHRALVVHILPADR